MIPSGDVLARRDKMLRRVHHVEQALKRWDNPAAERPLLSRDVLQSLLTMLRAELRELDALAFETAGDRRN